MKAAAKRFQPYNRTQEVNVEARQPGAALIPEGARAGTARRTFIFVNNRLEGNALGTIEGVVSMLSEA